ncbi:MAG: hypothetical protein AMJ91_06185 [candidate division Zixibacteria bacterium SM23_73_3]|nr:MAG: hypothetical protein AMJ91_06185 [candidate division Zixibacteria bacterium SM23_73_3]
MLVTDTLLVTLSFTDKGVRDERELGGPNKPYNQKCIKGIVNIKKRLNHKIYLQVLRQMSPEKRLMRAFELSEFTRQLFIHGLHKRFPNLSEEEFKKILLKRLDKCHNRNY